MKQSEIEQLFKKFLNDQCTQDEVRTLLNLIEKGKYPTYLEPLLDQYWNKLKHYHTLDSIHSKKLLVNIKSSIERRNRTLFQNIIWKVAASIVLVVGLGLFGYVLVKSPGTTKPEWITKEARIGEKLNVVLADGTVVKLNADSRMSYPSEFGKARVVKLQGEAFFEVEPDPDHPFVVQSGDLTTTVLGTSFNVRAFSAFESLVAVKTGRVKVKSQGNESVELVPDQMVSMMEDGHISEVMAVNDQVFGWVDKELIFRNNQISEVIHTIENWYGVTIDINKNNLSDKPYTARFVDPALPEVMTSLSELYEFKYLIDDGKVIIR